MANLLPLLARNERGEGWGEGYLQQKSSSSPRPSPPSNGREGEGSAFSALAFPISPAVRTVLHGFAFLLALSSFVQAANFEVVTNDGIALVQIPAGTFAMGTTEAQRATLVGLKSWTRFEDCELPTHAITISKPFLIGKFEITQKQWEAVMGKNPSAFKDENNPVESVSWDEVQKFIEKLNEKNNAKYRLPTEAEWEYCCRAGSTNLFGLGTNDVTITAENLGDFAWFRKNSENRTHRVGEKQPNTWGLYDVHGNVWEWCQDWYASDYYAKAPEKNPLNTAPSTERAFRGGSWFLDGQNLRATFRSGNLPGFKSQYVGFRLARELE
ncbi:MAG: formylglycine-generating enzyme family protein [Verrucomicrobiota bacterium]